MDEETGLYYYGARYYDPKTNVWQSVDPLVLYDPVKEVEAYLDGQHNGGVFNSGNLASYSYTYGNPVKYVDPNGKQVEFMKKWFMNLVLGDGAYESEMKRQADHQRTYGTADRTGPTKNITGNYFGDAAYKLMGGETISKAFEGDDRAQGQVIMGSIVSMASASKANSVNNVKTKGISKYSKLAEPKNIGIGKKFTQAQKKRILQANRDANNGILRSDMSGNVLDQPVQSKKGIPANMNQAEIDHIYARSKGGTNSNKNAQVLSKRENLDKRDN